ncbi:hypothetical protein HW555_006478 [Spodoptera exigua]|uniref:MADF domain-containing protein n=1 Tax=Spodoptera exigua TaxID=7107 RepID=A0A835GIJ9_SPOEX|nr:hypothetical protein HW555_006478 [Spodoptera exigua]
MQLIELFQSKPLLWDCSIKQYKDRNKKNDAFEKISKVPNIPKKDVETKIHREKKDVGKKTTGSGAIEKCKWIYYEPLEFLLCGATTSVLKKMDEREKKDPFDIYGEYIAAELRSVKDDQALTQAK